MIAGILAIVTIVILIIQVQYYRNKAREFESLFELSKNYNRSYSIDYPEGGIDPGWIIYAGSVKLNKDGSIAKKRGRKSNVKTT